MEYYDYSVVVCGCTKNSSQYIENHLNVLMSLKSIFRRYRIVVYENDSNDDTVNKLEQFKKHNEEFNYISENNVHNFANIIPWLQTRPQYIAHGRNMLLKYIHTHHNDIDYLICVDLDDVISQLKPKQFKYLFENDTDEWDALFGNCIGKYYDIWALRMDEKLWNSNDSLKLWNHPVNYDCWEMAIQTKNVQKYVYDHQVVIPVHKNLIPVISAFGGFGIYKYSAILNCNYNSIENNKIRCEHVSFHKQMIEKNQAKLFICPKFLVTSQKEHTR